MILFLVFKFGNVFFVSREKNCAWVFFLLNTIDCIVEMTIRHAKRQWVWVYS